MSKKSTTQVYVAFGANLGDTHKTVSHALHLISHENKNLNFKVSNFYKTTPVSPIPQDDYLNGVCSFQTSFNAVELCYFLQKIEKELGKVTKHRDAPRMIDLDILFFGDEHWIGNLINIPHPRWSNRLFVLVPLSELIKTIYVPSQNGTTKQITLSTLINELGNTEKIEEVCKMFS